MKAEYKVGNGNIELVQGSLTNYPADALVCPANYQLEMVAWPGTIQRAFLAEGGPEIFIEAQKLGERFKVMSMDTEQPAYVSSTSAHLTTAGKLPAKHVIHAVTYALDRNRKGGFKDYCDKDVISRTTKNVLNLAREKELKSVGFPTLGTGLYDVPMEESVDAIGGEFISHLRGETSIERLGLVLYTVDDFLIGKEIMDGKILPN